MKRMPALAVLAASTAACACAHAAEIPTPLATDPRISVVGYDPSQVVELCSELGYQTLVEFDPAERIENVGIGDGLAWQVTPNHKADLLFLKPMQSAAAATNMTVVTNQRRYLFRLTVRGSRDAPRQCANFYAVRFVYPPPPAPPASAAPPVAAPVQDLNHSFSYQGSAKLLPARVFDDGKATYFQFAEGADYPAIFAVEADGEEAVVNTSARSGYVVVDRMARGFVLRQGAEVLRLYNDGWREPGPGPQSPVPRPAEKHHFLWFSR
jgi:type IV secretion system protein VirB9